MLPTYFHHPTSRIIYGNLTHRGEQPGVCPSSGRQVISSAGQHSNLGMTTTRSSHLPVIFLLINPVVLELFSPLSLLSSVLWLTEFSSLGLEFLSSLPLLSSIPWPLQFQSLDFGIPQSLGSFTLNSMVLGLLNPFIPQVTVSPHTSPQPVPT